MCSELVQDPCIPTPCSSREIHARYHRRCSASQMVSLGRQRQRNVKMKPDRMTTDRMARASTDQAWSSSSVSGWLFRYCDLQSQPSGLLNRPRVSGCRSTGMFVSTGVFGRCGQMEGMRHLPSNLGREWSAEQQHPRVCRRRHHWPGGESASAHELIAIYLKGIRNARERCLHHAWLTTKKSIS